MLEWAEPEQTQDVELLRMKEDQLAGPRQKRLKQSKILDDLGASGAATSGDMGGSYNE